VFCCISLAFDLRGALFKRHQPDLFPNSQATLQKPRMKKGRKTGNKGTSSSSPRGGRGGRRAGAGSSKRGRKRKQQYEDETEEEEDDDEDIFASNGDEDFSDFDADEIDPRDLIITPDISERKICSSKRNFKTERVSPQEESDYEAFPVALGNNCGHLCRRAIRDRTYSIEFIIYCFSDGGRFEDAQQSTTKDASATSTNKESIGHKTGSSTTPKSDERGKDGKEGDEDKNSSSESSTDEDTEEFKKSYPRKKMEWNLVSTYPNYDAMLKAFPLQRDWAIHTSCIVAGKNKKYYYCKLCSKKGPIRLQVIYEDHESEVEILQNNHAHAHDVVKVRRKFLCEEMKSEIFTLYRAGLKNSTQIIDAIKTSKPHLKLPTVAQVIFLLRATRKEHNKMAKKLKKQQAEEALMKAQINSLQVVSQLSTTTTPGNDPQSHPQLPLSQSYLSTGSLHMRGMPLSTITAHLSANNSFSSSSGYGHGQQNQPATSTHISTPIVSSSQFTYDPQALLQFPHQSHH